ncbi:MAG: tetratricopeptide repeat protein [Patescibacteria group bacterium]
MSNHKNIVKREPNLLKFLQYGIYLIAFIPLVIFSQYISPFHFGKVFVFRSLIEILAVFYLVLIVKYGKQFLPPRTALFWAISIFTAAFGLATFTSINFYQSFFGTLERMGGWFSFIHFWGFFVIATSVLRKKEEWLTFIKLSLFASLLSAFYGFLQKTDISWVIGSGGRAKIFGTIGNSALFAGYMIINAFMALMLYFKPSASVNEKRFYIAVFILDAFAVLLTGVRGSVLGVIVGILVFGFLYSYSFGSVRLKKMTIGFFVLVIAVAGILYSLRNTDFVKSNQYLSRYADISPKAYTVQTRTWAWRAGFNGWNDSFKSMIFGWGPEMFNIPFSKHFNPKFFRGLGSETLFDRAHNQFLEVLFTMGLVGFLTYLFIYFVAFRDLKRLNSSPEEKVFKIGLISALVAYMIHNSFIFDTSANYIMFFLVLGFINFLSQRTIQSSQSSMTYEFKNKGLLVNIIGIILAIAAIFSIYRFEVIPAKANYATTRAIIASWSGNHDLAFEKFKKAMSYDTFGKYDIRHRYNQYILELANRGKVDEKTGQRLLVAVENTKKNVAESPQDYLPYLYISRSYILLGKNDPNSEYNDLALENSLKAFEISPTFVRTYYEVAQVYLNKKDYQKAIEWFEKVVELNPEVGLSYWYLGITLAQAGQLQKGAETIEKSDYDYKSNEADALRMAEIYLRMKNFQKVAEIYEALIKLNSKNPQYFASLAVAYREIGQIDKAIKAAQTASQIDPAFAKEAQNFIDSLR